MGPKRKIGIAIILIILVILGVFQLSTPRDIPVAGTKYLLTNNPSHTASWVEAEKVNSGTLFLIFTISNTSYARQGLSTSYTIIISKLNQTTTGSLTRSFTIKVTGLTILDNYDPSFTGFDVTGALGDAVQVDAPFYFRTPNNQTYPHQLRFTINYDLYDLYLLGYSVDHSQSRAFNITQNIL